MLRGLRISLLAAVAAAMLAVPAFAQAPIKIGVLTPLSPPGDAAAGQLIVRGAKMAADEINAAGRHSRRTQDRAGHRGRRGHAGKRRGGPAQARLAGQGLGGHRAVPQLGDGSGPGPCRAAQGPDLLDPGLGQEDHREAPELYLPHPRHRPRPRHALEQVDRQQQGFKRVALLAENTDYGIGLAEETKKQFAASMTSRPSSRASSSTGPWWT